MRSGARSGNGSKRPYRCNARAGSPDDRLPGADVVDDDGVGADRGAGADPDRADDLGPGPDLHVAPDRRAVEDPGAKADRYEGRDHGAGADLGDPVDHNLAVDDVDAGLDDNRVADRDLRDRHRKTVGKPWQDGHAQRLQARLQAVEGLGQEGVADPHQAQRLQHRVGRRAELGALAAVGGGDASVGEDGLAKPGVSRATLAQESPATDVLSSAHGARDAIPSGPGAWRRRSTASNPRRSATRWPT